MKIVKIILSIFGILFLIPFLFFMWIAVVAGIAIDKCIDEVGDFTLPIIGIFAIAIVLQFGWISLIIAIMIKLIGK